MFLPSVPWGHEGAFRAAIMSPTMFSPGYPPGWRESEQAPPRAKVPARARDVQGRGQKVKPLRRGTFFFWGCAAFGRCTGGSATGDVPPPGELRFCTKLAGE